MAFFFYNHHLPKDQRNTGKIKQINEISEGKKEYRDGVHERFSFPCGGLSVACVWIQPLQLQVVLNYYNHHYYRDSGEAVRGDFPP